MNLRQSSVEIGRSKAYFSSVKKNSPAVFRFQKRYGNKNLAFGYEKWKTYVSNLTVKVEEIYYSFKREADFARWLHRNKLASTKDVGTKIARDIFLNVEHVNIKRVRKFKEIIKIYNKA